jgi:hypothetical protein
MRAQVGDRIVLAAVHVDESVRDGEVTVVHGKDGGPPYTVRWSDGHTGMIYPGPGAILRIGDREPGTEPAEQAAAPSGAVHEAPQPGEATLGHVREWHVRVSIFESGDETSATVVLLSDAPTHLQARGTSRRSPSDLAVPEIGDEIAVARALRHLADQLAGTAAADIEALSGKPAHVRAD